MSRQTKQKQLLEKEIANFTSFFTAEELYKKIHPKYPNLGLATIYRYLKNIMEEGKVHSYQCNRHTIYSTNTKNHSHFHCEQCQKTIHIEIKNLDFLKDHLPGEACHFQLDVSGVCDECLMKNQFI